MERFQPRTKADTVPTELDARFEPPAPPNYFASCWTCCWILLLVVGREGTRFPVR